jgi:hypothetical protein
MSILLVFAFVLFFLAAIPYAYPEPWSYVRFNLIAAGLACWVGSILFKV